MHAMKLEMRGATVNINRALYRAREGTLVLYNAAAEHPSRLLHGRF